jgi:large subunit ribosomal protein L3
LGFESVKKRRVGRALAGHFKKQGVEPVRFVREFRSETDGAEVGATVTVAGFEPGDRVDVVGISKGHGFSGGIKRHNFSGGGASHGSMIHRQPASNGDTNAGRTVKGSRRPGQYGVDRTTMQNLEVVRADAERNLLLLRGPVPGAKNGLVIVRRSVKAAKATEA